MTDRELRILKHLHNEVRRATDTLHENIADVFRREGEYVEVPYGNGTLRGEIVRTHWDRVVVLLDSTGREFTIDAWHFFRDHRPLNPLKQQTEDT